MVTKAPTMNPITRFLVNVARTDRILSPAVFFIPRLSFSIPYRNRASPPNNPVNRNPQDTSLYVPSNATILIPGS